MADDEKNETTEEETETPAVAEPEATGAEEVSDTESVSDTDEAPAPPERPKRSLKHVPRSQRRQRSKPKREAPTARKPLTRTAKPESERGRRQERRGVVVSDKGDKTIVVKVDVIKSHPKYKKVVRSTVKFHAHDEQNQAGVGDTVRIVETRPLSKTKHWRLAEVIEVAK
jgi:small subunit ribosomal protein S17